MSEIKSAKRLCIVAAGSGGHILPALQLGKKWLKENQHGEIIIFSSGKKLDATLLASFPTVTTIPLRINNYTALGIFKYPLQCIQLIIAFIKSMYGIIRFRPSAIISTGSIHTIPVAVAAILLRIPIHLYELNAVPGKAIISLAQLATSINGVFKCSEKYFGKNQKKFNLVPYPLKYTEKPKNEDKKELIKVINRVPSMVTKFDTDRKTILLLGGSQGSRQLNEWLRDFLIRHPEFHHTIQIIHQTGQSDYKWHEFYQSIKIPAYVFDFINDVTPCYQLADIVVCRAGAGTLFEVNYFEKTSIVVPLFTSTTSHQYDNALEMVQLYPDRITVITEKDLKKNFTALDRAVLQTVELANLKS